MAASLNYTRTHLKFNAKGNVKVKVRCGRALRNDPQVSWQLMASGKGFDEIPPCTCSYICSCSRSIPEAQEHTEKNV